MNSIRAIGVIKVYRSNTVKNCIRWIGGQLEKRGGDPYFLSYKRIAISG
ncbi:hypothetical protein [Cytobacillus sp. FSL R5-0596]